MSFSRVSNFTVYKSSSIFVFFKVNLNSLFRRSINHVTSFFLFNNVIQIIHRDDPPSQSTILVTQELLNLAYDWQPNDDTTSTSTNTTNSKQQRKQQQQQPLLDPVKDLKITDIEFVDSTKRVRVLEKRIACFQCLQCQKINEHVSRSKMLL